ncbi:outer membrane protein assembly factor BamB [Thiohalorhabdus sp.]|uniref:outer membrane protein assembly factor BamB n=1 Tax=Thiohalorhabdus sp. TaxID=3094134 RepID=UPI002FC31BCF
MIPRSLVFAGMAAVLILAGPALSDAKAQPTEESPAFSPYRSWALPLFTRWSIRPYAAARMAAQEGVAFVGTRSGRLAAVDSESGAVRWVRDLEGRIPAGPAVTDGGRVIVGTGAGWVLAVDAESGETLWRSQVSSEVVTVPRIASGMVFVGTADDFLWALRTADGGTRWSFNVEGKGLSLRGASRPAFHRGRVFTGFSTGELVALESGDGKPAWRHTMASPSGRTELERMVDVDAAPQVVDGTVIGAAYHGSVVALNADDGQQLWQRSFSVHNDPVVTAERVFLTTAEGDVMALERRNGGTMWTQEVLRDAGSLSPPVVTDRAVVVADADGRVTWFERAGGRVLGQIQIGPSAIHGPPLPLEGGGLLVLTDQGTLNRVGLPE